MVGGHSFSRGHRYRILSNPLYTGEIDHKGQRYPGQHPAIIDRETWDAVQDQLARNGHERLLKSRAKEPSLLAGILYGGDGERLIATHAVKQGKRYRYYVSAGNKHRGRSDVGQVPAAADRVWRLPASELEPLVMRRLLAALRDRSWVFDQVPQACATVAERQALLHRAAELSSRLESADPRGRRGLLLALVARIVLEGEHLAIMMRTSFILSGAAHVRGSSTVHPAGEAIAEIRAPFVLARRGSFSRHRPLRASLAVNCTTGLPAEAAENCAATAANG